MVGIAIDGFLFSSQSKHIVAHRSSMSECLKSKVDPINFYRQCGPPRPGLTINQNKHMLRTSTRGGGTTVFFSAGFIMDHGVNHVPSLINHIHTFLTLSSFRLKKTTSLSKVIEHEPVKLKFSLSLSLKPML